MGAPVYRSRNSPGRSAETDHPGFYSAIPVPSFAVYEIELVLQVTNVLALYTFSHVHHVHHFHHGHHGHHGHHFEVKIEFFRNESVLILLNWFVTVQSGGVMVIFG